MSWELNAYFEWTTLDRARLDEVYAKLVERYGRGRSTEYVASDPTERDFLARLRANPRDNATRLVYADWLEERGDGDRALMLRYLAGQRVAEPTRIGQLDEQIDRAWQRAVAAPALRDLIDADEDVEDDEDDEDEDGDDEEMLEYEHDGFTVTFYAHDAGCRLTAEGYDDNEDDADDAAEQCVSDWVDELGGEIDEDTWLARDEEVAADEDDEDTDEEEVDEEEADEEEADEDEDDMPFADWPAIVEYVREGWGSATEIDENGAWVSRCWVWSDSERTQQLALDSVEIDGEVWVRWYSVVARRDQVDAKDLIEKVNALLLGRIEIEDDFYRLAHALPLATITPHRLEEFSEFFVVVCDDLEESISGQADEF